MKLINNILTITLAAFSLVGCDSFLEDEIEFTSEEDILTSGFRSRGLINDIYSDYSFEYTRDFNVDYLTDNAVRSSGETDNTNLNWNSISSHPYDNIWARSYDNIRRIYEYIDLVHDTGLPFFPSEASSDSSDDIVQRYYGEAFFLKAWAEWELLKIYGGQDENGNMLGFPIVDDLYEAEDQNGDKTLKSEDFAQLSRNTYDECVNQIMEDLQIAIDNLPLNYTGSDIGFNNVETGRASGLAAYALKAKVALFAASPAFNTENDITKWELAAEYAHDMIEINGGLKSLQAIDNNRENNPDHLWRLRNSRSNNSLERALYPPTLYGQGDVNPSQNLVDAFPDSQGYPISDANSSFDVLTPYASRDSRFYKSIFYNADQCYSQETCDDFGSLEIFTGGQDNFGGFISDVGTRTGYYLKKFLNNLNFEPLAPGNPQTNDFKVYVQLGLTEVYLAYAEALNEISGPDTAPAGFNISAKEALARVRQRAGFFLDPYLDEVSTNQSDFRNLVRNERRIELCFTGERFHDLRRWKEIDNIENIKGTKVTKEADDSFTYLEIDVEERAYDQKNYYLPLPYTELLLNTNLKQNQGW
ncbi:MAG: RagB/SusD family nutrient uptake outer membrane protein [Algibacter sp.]